MGLMENPEQGKEGEGPKERHRHRDDRDERGADPARRHTPRVSPSEQGDEKCQDDFLQALHHRAGGIECHRIVEVGGGRCVSAMTFLAPLAASSALVPGN